MHSDPPLIVTLLLDEESVAFFNVLRKKYFPPALNFLAAHLTLFHHLPSGNASIEKNLETWSQEQAILSLQVTAVKCIGRGVAYKMESKSLLQLHKQMQQKWEPWLTPQDKQTLWPHITVQNKVSAVEAKHTLTVLQASFQPFTSYGLGFSLWAYEGGPWRFLHNFLFAQ